MLWTHVPAEFDWVYNRNRPSFDQLCGRRDCRSRKTRVSAPLPSVFLRKISHSPEAYRLKTTSELSGDQTGKIVIRAAESQPRASSADEIHNPQVSAPVGILFGVDNACFI